MNPDQIADVLNLTTILSTHGNNEAAHQPYLIAALLDWKDGGGGNIAPAPPAPVAPQRVPDKVATAIAEVAEYDESDVDPDPVQAAEPEPVKAPAKKAAAKAAPKARSKPPAATAPADDDDF